MPKSRVYIADLCLQLVTKLSHHSEILALTCANVSWAYPTTYLVALVDDRSRTTAGLLVKFQIRHVGVLDLSFEFNIVFQYCLEGSSQCQPVNGLVHVLKELTDIVYEPVFCVIEDKL